MRTIGNKPRKKTTRTLDGVFHLVSFVGGSMLGAAIAVAITYEASEVGLVEVVEIPSVRCSFMDELPDAEDGTGVQPTREYLVLVAHFLRVEDAKVMQAELILSGMSAAIATSPRASGGSWHRVVVGPYAGMTEAQSALDRLHAGDLPGQILAVRTGTQVDG